MKAFKKIAAMILVLVIMVSMFGSCAAKEKGALERIKEAGELVMLTNAAFAPFEYLDADGNVAGVDVELSQAIADEIGVKLTVQDMDFDLIVDAIKNGKGDIGAAGITANDERKKSVDFSVNYVDTGLFIVVKNDNAEIAGADDLVGKSVGVQTGTTSDLLVSDIEGVEVVRFKTVAEAAMALGNGQIDSVVCDELPAQDMVNADDTLKILEEPLSVEQYAIALNQNDDELTELVNKVIDKLVKEGKIEELIAKHMEAAKAVA